MKAFQSKCLIIPDFSSSCSFLPSLHLLSPSPNTIFCQSKKGSQEPPNDLRLICETEESDNILESVGKEPGIDFTLKERIPPSVPFSLSLSLSLSLSFELRKLIMTAGSEGKRQVFNEKGEKDKQLSALISQRLNNFKETTRATCFSLCELPSPRAQSGTFFGHHPGLGIGSRASY